MTEKNNKPTGNLAGIKENEAKGVVGEETRKLKDEELEQSTGGNFTIIDRCQGHYDDFVCRSAVPPLPVNCPNLIYTKRVENVEDYYQMGYCKKGCFKEQVLFHRPKEHKSKLDYK